MEKNFLYVEDIIADEHFQSWYFQTNAAMVREWEGWMTAHPGQTALVNEARQYMDNLSIAEKELPQQLSAAAEQRFRERLKAEKEIPQLSKTGRLRAMSRWWWAAAATVLLLASVITLQNILKKPGSVHTAFGEIREQHLPDGSVVMLNANSEITYAGNWDKGAEREVWLKGEAFFHVAKEAAGTRFVVHARAFDVIVTGTRFNVKDRDNTTNVLLTEGSVTLHTRDGRTINMKPGDFVEVTNRLLEKKTVQEEGVLAWRDKKLHFEDTPLRDVVQQIKEHYGVIIQLDNEALGNKPITGILPNDNLEILLQALEATRDFRVVHKDSSIVITY